MSMTHYPKFGVASVRGYDCASGLDAECISGQWHRIEAEQHNTDEARRGYKVGSFCCSECQICSGCFCNGSEINDDPPGKQDAWFSMNGADPEVMEISFSGVTYGGSDPWLEAIWEAVDINTGDLTLDWGYKNTWWCEWHYTGPDVVDDYNHFTWNLIVILKVFHVAYSGGEGTFAPGDFYVKASANGVTNNQMFKAVGTPYCSDKSMQEDNDVGTGSCFLTWDTDQDETPQYFDITFSGLTSCPNCDRRLIVDAAIKMLQGDSPWGNFFPPIEKAGGRVWRLWGGCTWRTPYFQILDYPGWYLKIQLKLSSNNDDTDWELEVWIEDLRHSRIRYTGVERYFCDYDRDRHYIFIDTQLQTEHASSGIGDDCFNPPNGGTFNNEIVCGAHPNVGGGGADDILEYHDCATGGSASVVAQVL